MPVVFAAIGTAACASAPFSSTLNDWMMRRTPLQGATGVLDFLVRDGTTSRSAAFEFEDGRFGLVHFAKCYARQEVEQARQA